MVTKLICIIIQVVVAKNIESHLKTLRHNYMKEPQNLMPTDIASNLFGNGHIKPQKVTDDMLAVLHDQNTDSYLDKTKNDRPNRVNFMKWFEDVMASTRPTSDYSLKDSQTNCTGEKDLANIVHNLSVLNDNINELKNSVKSNSAYLVMKVPDRPKYRNKRDVNTTEANIGAKTENGSDNGRRYMAMEDPNDVKSKLLFYLEDAFNEVDRKIESLSLIKNIYNENNNFKIGYIVANIDTLEVNLKSLRDEMDKNKHLWDDRKILDIFDKLKASDNVLSSLLESLKMYVHMKNVY